MYHFSSTYEMLNRVKYTDIYNPENELYVAPVDECCDDTILAVKLPEARAAEVLLQAKEEGTTWDRCIHGGTYHKDRTRKVEASDDINSFDFCSKVYKLKGWMSTKEYEEQFMRKHPRGIPSSGKDNVPEWER